MLWCTDYYYEDLHNVLHTVAYGLGKIFANSKHFFYLVIVFFSQAHDYNFTVINMPLFNQYASI